MLNKFSAFNLAWGISGAAYLFLAYWLFSFPPSIPSDDAYFFTLGVESFSLLEFRPHFPAYPGFIALGKFLHFAGFSPKEAVFHLSLFGALCLPALAAWVAKNHGAEAWGTVLAFWATLTQPFLPLVGLSMMSDSSGIAFFLLSLGLFLQGRLTAAGLAAGLTLACRPSFLLPVVALLLVSLIKHHKKALPLYVSCVATLAALFGAVILIEGPAFFQEAWRFTEGHFLVWGNTSLGQDLDRPNWVEGLSGEIPTAMAIMVLLVGFIVSVARDRMFGPLVSVTLAAILWTALAQNPENLRHLLLPSILLGICLSVSSMKILAAAIVIQGFVLTGSLTSLPRPSPLEHTTGLLRDEGEALIVSNHGIAYLRNNLPHLPIADAYYQHSGKILAQSSLHQKTLRIHASSWRSPMPKAQNSFKGRVAGEKTFSILTTD